MNDNQPCAVSGYETTIIWGACGSVRLYVCLVSLIDPCDWLWEILSVHMKFGQLWDDEREVMPCFHRRHRVLASLSSRSKGRHTSGASGNNVYCGVHAWLFQCFYCAIITRRVPLSLDLTHLSVLAQKINRLQDHLTLNRSVGGLLIWSVFPLVFINLSRDY
jgi:hypothetical protein